MREALTSAQLPAPRVRKKYPLPVTFVVAVCRPSPTECRPVRAPVSQPLLSLRWPRALSSPRWKVAVIFFMSTVIVHTPPAAVNVSLTSLS